MQQLEKDLEAARKRIDDLARAYQASQADSERFKERLTRERERMIDVDRGNAALLVIEAIDQLDLVLSAATPGPMTDGVRLVRDSMVKKLADSGVERLELKGLPYDPNLAEAADTELVTSPAHDGTVTQVTRAGYVLKERVIRPAQVRVGRYLQPAQA
ncbi:MAG: nucleotide exchange factor GrpE [Myxococcaceae bacterium]